MLRSLRRAPDCRFLGIKQCISKHRAGDGLCIASRVVLCVSIYL